MINNEINEIDKTIKNEEIFLLGSISEEDIKIHQNNIIELLCYKDSLKLC